MYIFANNHNIPPLNDFAACVRRVYMYTYNVTAVVCRSEDVEQDQLVYVLLTRIYPVLCVR